MRIIAGKYKGKKLEYPLNHPELKPTQDRIKESMFSILAPVIEDASVLDLFAGTGNLGFESLSRGASRVVLVDTDPMYCFKNKSILLDEDQKKIRIVKKQAKAYLAASRDQMDLIFLDPPWSSQSLFLESLKCIFEFDILKSTGLIVCENPKNISCKSDYFFLKKIYSYGRKQITLLCHQP